MNQETWYLTTSRLALAAAFAAGLAASPFAINDGTIAPNAAVAQTTQDTTGATPDGDGEAEEFVEDPTSDPGGTGSPGVSSGEKQFDLATVNTDTPAFQEYKSAAERNDLKAAARALSDTDLAAEAMTPEMIEQVNEELEVRTSLTAEQIAEAVREDLPY